MARKKSYSSTVRQAIDNLQSAVTNLTNFLENELPEIQADAEAYQEFKPIINKIAAQSATSSPPVDQETPEPEQPAKKQTGRKQKKTTEAENEPTTEQPDQPPQE